MVKFLRKVSLLLLACFTVGTTYAISGHETAGMNITQQNGACSGVVKDASGEPVIGASVRVKGTSNGSITDADGRFSIANVKRGDVIQVTFVGYQPQEVKFAGQPLSVVLSDDAQVLNEVVVTALGIKRQSRSLGYSTTQVGGEEFTLARDPNMGNALSGKVAGVSVAGNATGSGGSSRVIIRGNASLTGNNQPLYVVDGVPFDNTNQGSAGTWGGMDMGDGLNNINADDVESIQVLKGAAASALYGYRGGNGAILITTKSGKKDKGTNVEFNNNLTFNMIYDNRDFQKVFGQGINGKRPTDIQSAKDSETSNWGEYMDGGEAVNFLGQKYRYSYIDNWDNFYRTGVSNSTSLAISGADDKVVYRVGLTNMFENGILPNSSNRQQAINLNTTYNITKRLHFIMNANYVFEKANGRSNLSDGNGNTNASLMYHANSFDIRWMKRGGEGANWGTNLDGSEMISGTNVYFNNPYWLQYRKTNNSRKNRLTGAMTLKWDITDWLYAQGAVQRDGFNLEFKQVQPIGAAADPSGWMTEYEKNYYELNTNFLLGFDKKFGDWSVGATFGGNQQRNVSKQYIPTDGGRPFIVDGLWSVNNLSDKRAKMSYSEYKVNSFYGTADFGWRNQVFLNFTGRNDWFSTLSPDNNSYFYPSATISWVFSDSFRDKLPEWFTFGKIRASVAAASNGTSAYQNLLLYKVQDYKINGQNAVTTNNSNFPNPDLKPVKITEKEIGLNLAFLENRLTFDMAYYRKNTKDDIAVVSTSGTSGYGAKIMNVGEIQNQGFEFMMDVVPVKAEYFMWNSTVNFAYNDSKVKYLGGVDRLAIDGATSRSGNVSVQNVVGSAYGELIGYKYKRDDQGNIVFQDGVAQNSGKLESLGNGVYKFTGGWRNALNYKNWTLAFLVDFKFGAKLFSGTNYSAYGAGLHKNTLVGRTKEDPNAKIVGKGVMWNEATGKYVTNTVGVQASTYYGKIAENNIAEEFIYDASFIKLREVSLAYDFPKAFLAKLKVVKGVNISLVGRNLWTVMKHTDNIDPEAAYNNSNGQGLELNGYPATRNVGFNVNVKF